jgi:hypothetical protein
MTVVCDNRIRLDHVLQFILHHIRVNMRLEDVEVNTWLRHLPTRSINLEFWRDGKL